MHAEGQANRAADRVHPEEKESLAFEFVDLGRRRNQNTLDCSRECGREGLVGKEERIQYFGTEALLLYIGNRSFRTN
ncbi:hypothetical protein SUGI_1226560 [Cryptomeria japonica]|uniref:Uncharacterized protein n=1 Tax=Cryptomeria japonica TaxID=3369 RepID=A0AAD3RMG2_CRYJA|nr:hypothetical protein SUGI_1226560 [Cryptomeria japonica]